MDAKPKGKSEEIHPTVKKRYIAFAAIVILLAGAVAYFAFATHAPVKTGTGPPTEVKTPEVLATKQTVNTGQETAGTVIIPGMSATLLSNGQNYAISLDNIPEKIQIYSGTYYIRDLKKNGQYLYGYFGSKVDVKELYVTFAYFDAQGGSVAHNAYGMQYINPQTKEPGFGLTSDSGISFPKNTEFPFRVKISEATGQDVKFALITVLR